MNLQELIDQLPAQAANLERTLLDPRLPRGTNPALSLALERDWRGALAGHEWRFRAASPVPRACPFSLAPPTRIRITCRDCRAQVTEPRPAAGARAGPGWLKLAAVGDARVNLGRNTGAARLAVSGRGDVGLGAYLRVDPQATLRAALQSRRGAAAFVLDHEQVRGLGVDDACYIELGGTLSARVKLTGRTRSRRRFPACRSFCRPAPRSPCWSTPRASVALDFELDDSFRLVFAGRDADRIGSACSAAPAKPSASAPRPRPACGLSNPDIARELLADLAAQLLGVRRRNLRSPRGARASCWRWPTTPPAAAHRAGARRRAARRAIDEAGLPLARGAWRSCARWRRWRRSPIRHRAPRSSACRWRTWRGRQRIDTLGADLAARLGTRLDPLLAGCSCRRCSSSRERAARPAREARPHRVSAGAAASERVRTRPRVRVPARGAGRELLRRRARRAHPDFERLHGQLLRWTWRRCSKPRAQRLGHRAGILPAPEDGQAQLSRSASTSAASTATATAPRANGASRCASSPTLARPPASAASAR
jgi:hypothetical protein